MPAEEESCASAMFAPLGRNEYHRIKVYPNCEILHESRSKSWAQGATGLDWLCNVQKSLIPILIPTRSATPTSLKGSIFSPSRLPLETERKAGFGIGNTAFS